MNTHEISYHLDELTTLQLELAVKQGEIDSLRQQMDTLAKDVNHFTYIVSHDLQAPLRTIAGFLDLLERKYGDKLDDTAKGYIDFAVKGAAKMKDLVFDLLDYSRLGSDTKEATEVDLNMILQEVKDKLAPVIDAAGAIITSEDLPVVMAKKAQMAQLFFHLLENAVKFRDTAVPEINLTLNRQNDFWQIAIQDNGPGIDAAFLEKIFIVFRRLHNDESRYDGTGIGLALCKKIVELHGGVIGVESAVGKGSRFYFTLPATS